MVKEKKGILFVGNFLSKKTKTRALCEELALKLSLRGFSVYKTTKKKNRFLKVIDIMFNIIKHKNNYSKAIVDLFSGKAFWWGFLSSVFLKVLNKPFIIVLRGGDLPKFSRKNGRMVKYIFKSAKYVISPSGYLKEEMKSFREDIFVIPNPIEIKNYVFKLRKKLNRKLIWIRAFHHVYNPKMAILTFEELYKSYNDTLLCMIGPDKEDGSLKEIKEYIKEKDFRNNVLIIEGILKEEVPFYLNDYDIFLNTSNIDNFPVTVLEALACGLCVVTTKVGGIPFFLKEGEDSLFVPPDNFIEMAKAIDLILKDETLAEKLSKNARRKAEDYSWEKVLPLWEDLLNG